MAYDTMIAKIVDHLKEEAVKIAEEEAEDFSTVTAIAVKIIKKGIAEYKKQIEEAFKEVPDYASHEEGKWMFSIFKNDSLPIIVGSTTHEFKHSLKNEIKSIIKPILIEPKDSTVNHIKV